MLVQRRADGKYHSGGLWSNACCGHPRPGEEVIAAAGRRLREEMGIACPLVAAGTVSYSIDVGGGMREDEFNHVLVGSFSGDARPDPSEVSGWRWMTPHAVQTALREVPAPFTPWFPVVLGRLRAWIDEHPAALPPRARRAWLPLA
jgi:isopentenyl-diphosphate delta-isomerase